MPLPFNRAMDLKLLSLVKDSPVIYNTKHDRYLNFDAREVAWQRIGDILNRPGHVCKTRWVNIRDMMRRRIRERLKNPEECRTTKYRYEDQLQFMIPFFKESSNLKTTNEEYVEYLDDSNNVSVEVDPFENETEEYIHEEDEREIKPNISYQKRPEETVSVTTEYLELNPTDPLDVFLITVGSTLRKFSPYYLNQAKSKIFQVVQDYELQQIVNKDDQPGNSDYKG